MSEYTTIRFDPDEVEPFLENGLCAIAAAHGVMVRREAGQSLRQFANSVKAAMADKIILIDRAITDINELFGLPDDEEGPR